MATDVDETIASTVDAIRDLAGLAKTDAEIGRLLGLDQLRVKILRHQNRIPAGYYLNPPAGSVPRRARQAVKPLPQPLTPAEVEALRAKEADSVRGKPAVRGWCRTCREWLVLQSGRLPMHEQKLPGVERHLAPRCPKSMCPPGDPDRGV